MVLLLYNLLDLPDIREMLKVVELEQTRGGSRVVEGSV